MPFSFKKKSCTKHFSQFQCQNLELIVYLYRISDFSSIQQFEILEIMAWKTLKGAVYHFDMFCSNQLLRYRSETHYKTLTGGLLSLAIICVIVAGFFDMIIETLNRTQITSSLTITRHLDPPLATLVPGEQNMFMLGLCIRSFDLSFRVDLAKGPQYFTVLMNIAQVSKGGKAGFKRTAVPLEPCTKEHWKMVPQFLKVFEDFNVESWMCVPLGFPLPIKGTFVSDFNQQISIKVYPCNNATSNNSCASQQQIDELFQKNPNFYLNLNYINPVISPISQKYITYHNEISDYIIFSRSIGSEAWLYFSDYGIKTDDSILPYSQQTLKSGCIVERKLINHPYFVTPNTPLASIFLAKSPSSLAYNRQVQKISAVFSYIGGLVGAITAFLFLIKSYTDSSLEVTIGINLFQPLNKDNQAPGKFHFLSYVRLSFYRILKSFGWPKISQYSEQLKRYQQEAVQQLDVQILLKRLIKLQSLINRYFAPEELAQIRESNPITVDKAMKMRSMLVIEQAQTLKESERSEGTPEIYIEGQQELSKYRQPKKLTYDLISSQKKRSDTSSEKSRHSQQSNNNRLFKPYNSTIQQQAEQSNTNILKRVKIIGDRNRQEGCLEVVIEQPIQQELVIDSYRET